MKLTMYTCIIVLIFLGVERNNDEAKKHIFSRNMHNIAGEILKADARLELLQKRDKRVTNMYTHKEAIY